MVTKRVVLGASDGPPPERHKDFDKLPQLWDMLTSPTYEDGTRRKTASLTLFFEEGQFKACLSDRDVDCVAFTSGDGLRDVLASLERRLQEGSLDWRQAGMRRKK